MKINFITSPKQFKDAAELLIKEPKICLDFETTGLQAGIAKPRLLQICSADLSLKERTIHVFDLFKYNDNEELKELVETRGMVIGHNLNFDFQFLLSLGIDF